MRLARKVRSAINGIWENEIIAMISKGDIDEETLDKLCEIIRNKENEGK